LSNSPLLRRSHEKEAQACRTPATPPAAAVGLVSFWPKPTDSLKFDIVDLWTGKRLTQGTVEMVTTRFAMMKFANAPLDHSLPLLLN